MSTKFDLNNLAMEFPKDGRVLLHFENDSLKCAEVLRENQHVATIPMFLEMVEKLGITIAFQDG